ncbi:tripeptide aminopeptidase [Elusimicrobium posterum]|uniref:tripeptide aminopeptidase PepT n=1 Tax=Elusimicrobium posterum TaxID=3116653 RepID=UPI003C718352
MLKKMLGAAMALTLCCAIHAQDTIWQNYNKDSLKSDLAANFKRYITYDTVSGLSNKIPSTKGQEVFLKQLQKEIKAMGYTDVDFEKDGSLQVTIPSNTDSISLTLGFIAHVDTAPYINPANIKIQEIKAYPDGDIVINKENNTVINPNNTPALAAVIGQDIIVSANGKAFGADPKAGVAIMMSYLKYMAQNPQIKHGGVKVAFTTDAVVLKGTQRFNVKNFGADFAFVLDGNMSGELIDETFYGRAFIATFTGNRTAALGSAADNPEFVDNLQMSVDFRASLPKDRRPETTTGRQGYIYPLMVEDKGNVSTVSGIIRDFDAAQLEALTNIVKLSVDDISSRYPNGKATLETREQYTNMKDALPDYVLTVAQKSMQQEFITPVLAANRGTSEGAEFSAQALPAPVLFMGGSNLNTEKEFVSIDVMEQALRTMVRITANTPAITK